MSRFLTFALGVCVVVSAWQVAAEPLAGVDRVLVEKSARKLTLLANGESIRSYSVALGANPLGPKERQGDARTPEGVYWIDARNPNSAYHRSLRISYPSREDSQRAAEAGVPPGGDIMIHGIPNGRSWMARLNQSLDWTDGCIAVTDIEIDEIWSLVKIGTVVEIRP
jgi:murein L,D-transpeptidase YafK